MPLIHPKLTAALTASGHFPATGTVQVKTITNTKGNPSESWANVSGLVDIPCAIAAASAAENRSPAYATRTHTALLDATLTFTDADSNVLSRLERACVR